MRLISALFALFAVAFAQPAHATGGLVCKTAGSHPIAISVGFGHLPSAGLFLHKLNDDGRDVPVEASQWWMRDQEVRLALVSPDHIREEAVMVATWNESSHSYDGFILRGGKRRWIRCREG